MAKNKNKLTKKEQSYWNIIKAQSGVLMLKGEPGIAKSAITRAIAEKNGMAYKDLRLSMVDESDVGVYPCLSEKNGMKVLDYAVPKWAIEANEKPTLIHFEELNRATTPVRNASLQLLLERAIGTDFKFNENVFFVTSGNLGEEDGTEVEEFDSALNNRLIHVRHTLTVNEWIDAYAEENVNPLIVSFLKAQPSYYYKTGGDGNNAAYASPRSWTFLSDFFKANDLTKIKDIEAEATKVGVSFVGPSITKFTRYCQDTMSIDINDIIIRWKEVSAKVKELGRSRISELTSELKNYDGIDKLTKGQMKNINNFLMTMSEDEKASYLIKLVDDDENISDNVKYLVKANETFLKGIVNAR